MSEAVRQVQCACNSVKMKVKVKVLLRRMQCSVVFISTVCACVLMKHRGLAILSPDNAHLLSE